MGEALSSRPGTDTDIMFYGIIVCRDCRFLCYHCGVTDDDVEVRLLDVTGYGAAGGRAVCVGHC